MKGILRESKGKKARYASYDVARWVEQQREIE